MFARRPKAFTLVELLVVIAIIAVLLALLLPAVQRVRESSLRLKCQNNLKQIGLAFHHYESEHGHFPRGWTNRYNSPLAYGRSHVPDLLPYLEQTSLHRLYNYDREWSHVVNRTAINTDLPLLACPSAPSRPGMAVNDYPVSDTISHDSYRGLGIPPGAPLSAYAGFFHTSPYVQGQNSIVARTVDITDGLSNTWLVFEDAGRPQLWVLGQRADSYGIFLAGNEQWADPANRITIQVWHNDTAAGITNGNEIYSFHVGGCNYLLGDGAVQFIRNNMSPRMFLAYYTRAGGEIAEP